MKLDAKKISALVIGGATLTSSVFAAGTWAIQNGLADWVSLVAELLSFICLAVFIIYAGRYIATSKNTTTESEENVKISNGVKNGIMTALVGVGICQAVIIIAQALFAR